MANNDILIYDPHGARFERLEAQLKDGVEADIEIARVADAAEIAQMTTDSMGGRLPARVLLLTSSFGSEVPLEPTPIGWLAQALTLQAPEIQCPYSTDESLYPWVSPRLELVNRKLATEGSDFMSIVDLVGYDRTDEAGHHRIDGADIDFRIPPAPEEGVATVEDVKRFFSPEYRAQRLSQLVGELVAGQYPQYGIPQQMFTPTPR